VKSLSLTLDGAAPHYELEAYSRDQKSPPSKFSGPIGLDGLYRKSEPSEAGVTAVKGKWLNTRAFEIERLIVGSSGGAQKWSLWFDGDTLTVSGRGIDGREVTVDGALGG
jgi:hypothetical protein